MSVSRSCLLLLQENELWGGRVSLKFTVGVPDVADKAHCGWAEGVVAGEFHFGDEDAAFVGCVGGAGD